MSSAWSVIAKLAIGFGVLLLLSIGLCGISVINSSTQSLAGVSIVGMVLGAGGLIVTGLASIVVAIMSAIRGGSGSPPPPPPPAR